MDQKQQQKVVLLLPDGFRDVNVVFKKQPMVDRQVYSNLREASERISTSDAHVCVLCRPTSETAFAKKEWCRLASDLASVARNGVKIIVVAPPRGDAAYYQNRTDINEAVELARKSVALMAHNIVSLVPMFETSSEPSHGPSAHPREASTDSYSKKAMVEYFRALVDYVKAEIVLPPFVESSSGRVRSYFKARKEAGVRRGGVQKAHSFKAFPCPGATNRWRMAHQCGRETRRGRGGYHGGHRRTLLLELSFNPSGRDAASSQGEML